MSQLDIVLDFLTQNNHQYCDDCISRQTSISPRQAVNKHARQLASESRITRCKDACYLCRKIKLVNKIV